MISNKWRKKYFWLGLFLLSISMYACTKSTHRIQYHSLTPLSQESVSPAESLPTILIGPVRVSSFLDQGPLVKQKSSYSLNLLEQHHWAGDIAEMLAQLITQNLVLTFDHEKIYSYPENNSAEGIRLAVTFFHFEKDASGNAFLEARWKIIQNKDQLILYSSTSSQRIPPKDSSYDAMAASLSQGVAKLCREMADTIIQLRSKRQIQP